MRWILLGSIKGEEGRVFVGKQQPSNVVVAVGTGVASSDSLRSKSMQLVALELIQRNLYSS